MDTWLPPSNTLFDILSRNTPVYCNRLIEASAGTGKTFTMEHLIVRLLLEETSHVHPPTLKEILAVTFTRAAVRDMRRRLERNLQHSLWLLNHSEQAAPDYLQAIRERGERARLAAIRRIESALQAFHECSLYTLHGFCAHSLSEHPKTTLENFSEEPVLEQMHRTVRHFFRTQLKNTDCHPVQLQKVLSLFRGEVKELEKELIKTLATGIQVISTYSFADSFQRFCTAMQSVHQHGPFTSDQILQDWQTSLPRYKQLNGKPAAEYTANVRVFAKLLECETYSLEQWGQLLEVGLPFAACEEKARLKQTLTDSELAYPHLPKLLRAHLLPLIEETLQPERIFTWMAHACQKLWQGHLSLEGGGGPDRLITEMVQAASNQMFAATVRAQYRMVLVDEFQDTDPLQWQLLETLFLHKIPLVLVGDPKQSIYAFRRADLYTYYQAAAHFVDSERVSLGVNYRSDGPLVHALNHLFSEANTPGLFDLPKLQRSMPYPPVQAAPTRQAASLDDKAAAIEFLLHKGVKGRKKNWPTEEIERQIFLPECIREMMRLNKDAHIPFAEMAVLVKDRHQAAYVHEELIKAGIPAFIQKRHMLMHSQAWKAWIEWLEAMLFPEDASLRHQALTGMFLRCPPESLLAQDQELQKRVQYMIELRQLLETKGLAAHAEKLFFTPYQEGQDSLFAYLLQDRDRYEMAEELKHILELLLEHQTRTGCSAHGLLTFLCTAQERLSYDELEFKARVATDPQAISIVTMHMSKGLEFDIVFCLGTAKRGRGDDLLLHDTTVEPALLRPFMQEDPLYRANCLERDAEKLRHAYVALTRAKKRLYVTYAIATDGSTLTLGEASPLDLFFARFNQPYKTLEELYPRLNSWQGESLCQWIDTHQDAVSMRYRFLQESNTSEQHQKLSQSLIPPQQLELQLEPAYTLSYTSSLKENKRLHEEKNPLLIEELFNDALSGDALSGDELPEGKETGIFLHHLLATLSWQRCSHVESPEALLPMLAAHVKEGPWKVWTPSLAALLYRAWHTPLPLLPNGETLKLAHVHSGLQSREMEFLYQDEKRPETLRWRGSIDLFFSHEGRYYLVDWKSHRLQEAELHGGREALARKVEEEGLLLQAVLYTKALQHYLKQVEARSFAECFGGFAFIFLRALDQSHIGRGIVLYSEEQLQQHASFARG